MTNRIKGIVTHARSETNEWTDARTGWRADGRADELDGKSVRKHDLRLTCPLALIEHELGERGGGAGTRGYGEASTRKQTREGRRGMSTKLSRTEAPTQSQRVECESDASSLMVVGC